MPEIKQHPTVPAETLSEFLRKERSGLVKLLRENEAWSRRNILFYPPLPKNLEFKGTDNSKGIQAQFVKAIRINPTLNFPLFVQYPPGEKHRIDGHPVSRKEVMLPELAASQWLYIPNPPLERVAPQQKVTPLEIITTASDEPDYGMDINLWENRPSWFGKLYDWGKEPFGYSSFFGSQAPFHMGFYYESGILYKLAPFLKRSYAEYRIHLFLTLARYAFKTGHDYWGYRFLGWALHYAQDLTQPYHSSVAPNINTFRVVFAQALDLLGSHSIQHDLVQMISNRHFSLENYEYHFVDNLLRQKPKHNPILKAIADQKQDASYPAYNDQYPRKVIAKESNSIKNRIDTAIRKAFPKKYVLDPNYIFYTTEPDVNLFEVVKKNPNSEVKQLNAELANLLGNYGAHTRNIVRYALAP